MEPTPAMNHNAPIFDESEIRRARIALDSLSVSVDRYYRFYQQDKGKVRPFRALQFVLVAITDMLDPEMQALLVREMKRAIG